MRKCVIVANWKMAKTRAEAVAYINALVPAVQSNSATLGIAVPFTAIDAAASAAQGTPIQIGAQNMNSNPEGAFTGEVSAVMLRDAGAQFVILGHSERRRLYSETNAEINKKVRQALKEGIQPLLCIGETLEEREAGKMEEVLKEQLSASLEHVSASQLANLWIAYEPVWAIGTGKTATAEQAESAHAFCRSVIEKLWDKQTADRVILLYGGSVNPKNAADLIAQPDVDGLLVGGASLTVESFVQIVKEAAKTDK